MKKWPGIKPGPSHDSEDSTIAEAIAHEETRPSRTYPRPIKNILKPLGQLFSCKICIFFTSLDKKLALKPLTLQKSQP